MADEVQTIVTSAVKEVTVYTNRALVTRRSKITLTGAERELVIQGLPLSLQTDSVRAGGTGTMPVKILEVRTEYIYATEPLPGKVAELRAQQQELEEKRRALSDRQAGLKLQRGFIQSLSEKSAERFSQSLARQQVGLTEAGQLLNFLGSQYGDFSTSLAQTEKEIAELNRQLEALAHQLSELNAPKINKSYNVIVSIVPSSAGDFELEISYLVDNAGWQPLYDARTLWPFSSVQLTYLAEVSQNSGEDWLGVRLTLSTAKPGAGALPPKLDPWYIDVFSGYARAKTKGGFRGFEADRKVMPGAMAAGLMREEAAPEPEDFEADDATVEMTNAQGVVTFRLEQNTDIPSDGTPHKTTIFSDNFNCRTEYIAMPRLVSDAYLQAIVTNNPNGATLLPGKVNIFRDNIFSGTSPIENIAPGQEFKLSLGVDDGLKIERDLVEREVDKKFIGGQRRITYAYRLLITYLRDAESSLKLTEQLPVSRNEQLKVKLTAVRPQIQLGELGVLEWNLPLPANARRELYYQFTVEHPTELTVSGLPI